MTRAHRINRASSLAVTIPKEYTVSRRRFLDDRRPQPHAPSVFLPQLLYRHLQVLGNELDLRLGNPDVTFARPGAAATALRAFKMQTGGIPRSLVSNCGLHRFPIVVSVRAEMNIAKSALDSRFHGNDTWLSTTSVSRRYRRLLPLRRILRGSRRLSSALARPMTSCARRVRRRRVLRSDCCWGCPLRSCRRL